MKLQLKRSNVIESGAAKEPTASQLEFGELAVNYNKEDPAIFLKDSNNNVIRISGIGNIADDGQVELPASNTPPANPLPGNLWYNSEDGRLYIYYKDPDTEQWVDASPDSWDPSSYPDVNNDTPQSGTLDDRYLMLDASNDPITSDLEIQGDLDVTGNITPGGTVDGRDVAADGAKLDAIEAGADVSQWVDVTGGINYPDGNVGIGTNSPGAKLDILATGDNTEILKLATERPWSFFQVNTGGSSALDLRCSSNKTFTISGTKNNESSNSVIFSVATGGGNVGIGTTEPLNTLHVVGSSSSTNTGATILVDSNEALAADIGGSIAFRGTDGSDTFRTYGLIRGGKFNSGSGAFDGYLAFETRENGETNTTEHMRIDYNGNVGIGTTNPTNKLHILSKDPWGGILIEDSSTSTACPVLEIIGKRNDGNTSPAFSGRVCLAANRGNGPVPVNKILGTVLFGGNHTDGSTSNILYTSSIAGISEGTFSDSNTMPTGIAFYTGDKGRTTEEANVNVGSECMRITSDGNVGIGTTSPRTRLQVTKSDDDIPAVGAPGAAQIGRGSGYGVQIGTQSTGRGYIQAQRSDGTATTYDLLLNPNGDNVGIGTTEPRASLEVRGDDVILAEGLGTSKSTIDIVSDKTSNNGADARPGICFRAPYSNGPDRPTYGAIYALKENSGQGVQNGAIVFATNSGAPGICEEKVRIPSTGGITFNGDTAAANALDDYEEGSFTPRYGNANTINHARQYGRYTKIGNKVTCWIWLRLDGFTASSSAWVHIAGLPFDIRDEDIASGSAYIGSAANFNTYPTSGFGFKNTDEFYLRKEQVPFTYADMMNAANSCDLHCCFQYYV